MNNKKKAIQILEEQKQKIISNEHPNNEEWTFETTSYIKDFFGFDSTEYSWISKFKWNVTYNNHPLFGNEEEAYRIFNEKPKKAIQFLDNCKNILENKGLYKKPKTNLVSDKSNFELIGIIIAISVFIFWIGYWTKSYEIFSFSEKQKKEKLK